MKRFTIILPLLIAIVALVIAFGIAAELQQVKAQIEDVTNYNGLHLSQSTFGTATPQLLIQNSGSANSLEIRDGSATPMVYVDADGNSTFAGTVDLSGATVSGVSTSTLSSLTVTGAAILNDNLAVDGNVAVTGTLEYSSLYPLGYANVGQEIVCGTSEFTATSEIEATGLSTITYVIASQTTDPASTGALLTVSDPTTSTFILYSWEGDYTAGTTPVEAHWCAVGDK